MGSVIRSSLMLELAVTRVYIAELSFLKQYVVYSSVLVFFLLHFRAAAVIVTFKRCDEIHNCYSQNVHVYT